MNEEVRKVACDHCQRMTVVPNGSEHRPGAITYEQFARGVAAINAYRDLVRAVEEVMTTAGEQPTSGLGGDMLTKELIRQLEERCNDPDNDPDGSMIGYMLYEDDPMCITADGREFCLCSPEALWGWWIETRSGPFSKTLGEVAR